MAKKQKRTPEDPGHMSDVVKYTVVVTNGNPPELLVFSGEGTGTSVSSAILQALKTQEGTVVYTFGSWKDLSQAVTHTEPLRSCRTLRVMCLDALVEMQGPEGTLLPPEDVLQNTFSHTVMTPNGVKTALHIKCDADNPEGRVVEQHPELLKDFIPVQEPRRVERSTARPAVERLCESYVRLGGCIDALALLLESFT